MKLDYVQRLTLGVTTAKDRFSNGVFEVNVAHEDWCDIFKNQACSCVPDISITVDNKKFTIDEDGVLHEGTN